MVTKAELDAILKTQRDAYNDAISHLMGNFEKRFEKLHSEFSALKEKFSEQTTINENQSKEIADLKSTIARFNQHFEESVTSSEVTSERLNYLEDQSRRNNLRFEGIPEDTNETWEHTAKKIQSLVQDKLGIRSSVPIDRSHRVGKPGSSRPRTIVARFANFPDRANILKNSKKLKGTNIFINEDLCEASRQKRREQLPLLRRAREEGKIAYFVHTKLVIKPKQPADDRELTLQSVELAASGASGQAPPTRQSSRILSRNN